MSLPTPPRLRALTSTRLVALVPFLALALLLAACSGPQAGGLAVQPTAAPTATVAGYAKPAILADVDWLAAHLSDPNVRVVALTSRADYLRGHIPGAAEIDWPDLKVTDTSDPSIAAWQADVEMKLGALGIRPGDTVVIYDQGTLYSARLWWILDQLGHKDKRILNGGLAAWQRAGKTVSTDEPTIQKTTYQAQPDSGKLATWRFVLDHLGDPRVKLVDARSPEEYQGSNTSGAKRGGHIPGAVNVDYVENARPDEPRYFRSQVELTELYASRGVAEDREVIVYCSTGVRASVDYFALKLIGYTDVRVYTGSWAEWGNRDDLPIER